MKPLYELSVSQQTGLPSTPSVSSARLASVIREELSAAADLAYGLPTARLLPLELASRTTRPTLSVIELSLSPLYERVIWLPAGSLIRVSLPGDGSGSAPLSETVLMT